MKRNKIKLFALALLGGLLAVPSVFVNKTVCEVKAEDSNSVTFNSFADKGSSNGGSGSSFSYTSNDVTVSTTGGYATNGVLRVYSGKKLTISSKNYKIGSIAFDMNSSYSESSLVNGVSGVNDFTWSHTMSKQVRFNSITVTFAVSDGTVSSLAVESAPKAVQTGTAISYSGVKVIATLSNEETYNVASKCEFSPAEGTILNTVGPQVVTVTYKASNTPTTTSGEDVTTTFTVSVTQGEKPTVYTKASSIEVGDQILFVNDSASKAAKATLTTADVAYKHYLDTTSVSISNNQVNVLSTDEVGVYTVEAGSINGTYAFKNASGKYLSTYAIDKDGLKFVDTKDAASSWTVDLGAASLNIKSNIANQAYDSYVYLRYNVNTFRAYKASSGVSETSIYKYSSGAEKISVPATASVIEGSSISLISETKGFTATSYLWAVGDSQVLSIEGSAIGSSVVVKGLKAGSTTVTVKANGNDDLVATCVVTVIAKKDALIENGEYFITDFSGSHVLNVDLEDVSTPDYTDTTKMWTITNTGADGDTYSISNGSNYLFHNPSIKNSSLDLSSDSSKYWIVTKNDDDSFTFAYSVTGNTLSCNPGASTGTWFAYSGATGTQDHIKLMKVGAYTGFEIEKLPTKKQYFVGDTLNPLNSKVNALFDNGAKVDITNRITWSTLVAGTKAYGTVEIGGSLRNIEMNGIQVYKGDASTFVISGLTDTYAVGEKINKNYLSVQITYKLPGEEDIPKTLTKDDYVVTPERIEETTTKVRIALAKDPTVYYEKSIEVKESPYVAANYVGVGDEIVIGTLGYNPYEITGGTELSYDDTRFVYSNFGYMPKGDVVLEVGKEGSYYTLKDKDTGYFLKGDNSTLGFNKPDTKSIYDAGDGHYEFNMPVTIGGSSYVVTMKTSTSPDFSYANVFSSMDYISGYTDYIVGISDLENNKFTFTLYTAADGYAGTTTAEVKVAYWSFTNDVFQYALETSSTLPDECLFTLSYDEDYEEWVVSSKPHQDKQLYFNKDGKFGFYAKGSSYTPIMLFRNNEKPLQSEVQSLSVSFYEGMDEVTVGEQFPWTSALIVKANYSGGASKIVPVGGYSIIEMPDTSKIGTAVGKIGYGQNGHQIIKEFSIFVKGKTQAFDVVCKDPILVGETYQAHLNDHYEVPEGEPLVWSVSDPTLASIDQNGNVTGLAPGYVDVIATSFDGTYSDFEHIRIYLQVESVTLSEHSFEVNAGCTHALTATVLPANASNTKVTYTSSDESVAIVDDKGVVTGIKPGTATITCAAQNKPEDNFDTCVVTVKEAPVVHVTGITLDITSKELEVNDTFKLTPTIAPNDATIKNVSYSSSNVGVATVDQNGNVTAIASGDCVITVTAADGGLTATCSITVNATSTDVPVTSVSLSNTSVTLNKGETYTLIATVTPNNATNNAVTWASSNESVVTVNNGVVTAVGAGEATVTVTTVDGAKTATATITVKDNAGPTPDPTPDPEPEKKEENAIVAFFKKIFDAIADFFRSLFGD